MNEDRGRACRRVRRNGIALRDSEPKQPLRLCKVYRAAFAVIVQPIDCNLRTSGRFCKVVVVHDAEGSLRRGVALSLLLVRSSEFILA